MAIPMNYETGFYWDGTAENGVLKIEGLNDIDMGSAEDAGALNPENMVLGAAEACHFSTFMAIAKNSKVDVKAYHSTASGELSFTKGEGYQFERIVVKPVVTVPESDLARAERVLEKAHTACLVTRTLNCECVMEVEWITV
jgi:organic hydroperoxide reductase OsmC/OhrA